MRDVINLMGEAVVVPNGVDKIMALEQAIDVSSYDELHLAVDTVGGGPNAVRVLTSMTLSENDSDWVEAASLVAGAAGFLPGYVMNTPLKVPASGKLLFRYVRWQIANATNANYATVRVTGLAHRS